MYFLQYADYKPNYTQKIFDYYKERFEKFHLICEPGEIYRQHSRIPFWFVSNHGRNVGVAKGIGFNVPFRCGRDWYYKQPKEFCPRDIKVQHLVAEVFPDQVIIPPNLPEEFDPRMLELHHIHAFDEKLGPYANNHADNLRWELKPYHRELHKILGIKGPQSKKTQELIQKYGKIKIEGVKILAVPLSAARIFVELPDGGYVMESNEDKENFLKAAINQSINALEIKRTIVHMLKNEEQK